MKKQAILALLERLPDEIPAEQLMHELSLMAAKELASANHDRTNFTDEELVEMGEDWYE